MRNIKWGKGLAVTGRWEGEQLQIGGGALIEVTFLRLEKTREWARLPSAGGIFQAEGRASARPRGKPCVWCVWGPACLLMARAVFPLRWLFGLRHPSTGAYRWLGRAGPLGCGEGIYFPVTSTHWRLLHSQDVFTIRTGFASRNTSPPLPFNKTSK